HDDPIKASSALHGEGTLTMPGGKLHYGERPQDGAKREVKEETDIETGQLKLISMTNDMVIDAHFVTFGFLCEDFRGEAKVMEPDEITQWHWFDLNDLPSPTYKSSQKIINNYNNQTFYSD
ncbi:MAG: NUDIX domain-containing protein, partial [Candidatus Parcubacteria bacterium]|nr:NUDIX domain-containing protein [Candidatus Parcubacteria bacterium]